MLDVDNCGNWVLKRNLKLENFLRENLRDKGSNFPRYYETCVIDWKGALLLRNVVVTDSCILFTENPPKNILLRIPFSDIQQISLVADRKTLIKGGNNNSYICQHVSLLHNMAQRKGKQESDKEPQIDPSLKMSKRHQQYQHGIQIDTSDFDATKSTSSGRISSRTGSDRALMSSSLRRNTYYNPSSNGSEETSDATTVTDISRQSSSLDSAYVPLSIYHAYEPIVYFSHPARSLKSTPTSLIDDVSSTSFRGPSSSSSSSTSTSKNLIPKGSKKQKKIGHKVSSSRNSDGRSSSESRSGEESDSSDTNNSDLGGRRDRNEGFEGNEDCLEQLVRSRNCKRVNSSSSSPIVHNSGERGRSRNLKVEQRPNWKNGEASLRVREQSNSSRRKARSESVDISQLSLLRRKMFERMFGSKDFKEHKEEKALVDVDKSQKGGSGSSLRLFYGRENKEIYDSGISTLGSESVEFSKDKENAQKDLQILNFYLYKPKSLLLNELFLFWNRHNLNCTLHMDEDVVLLQPVTSNSSHSLRATEKVFSKLSRVCSSLDYAQWKNDADVDLNIILPKITSLHRALMQYEHLRRIYWKNWNMLLQLVSVLRKCLRNKASDSDFGVNGVNEEDEEHFIDRVSVIAVIMDIFRLLYQACGTSWLIQKGENVTAKNNNNYNTIYDSDNSGGPTSTITSNDMDTDIIRNQSFGKLPRDLHELTNTIVKLILESELVPHAVYQNQHQHFNSNKISEESQRVTIIANVVLNPQKFSEGRWIYVAESRAIKAVTMAHNASSALLHEILCIVHFSSKDNGRAQLMSYLGNCPMETFVKLSLTQVVNLLWSNQRILNSSQTALLYRHVSVFQMLLDVAPQLGQFMRDEFFEEFRYFVHEESAERKIPDRYPLKRKLLTMCEELRQEIIGK